MSSFFEVSNFFFFLPRSRSPSLRRRVENSSRSPSPRRDSNTQKIPEPSASNPIIDNPDGRVRKGRGFTDRYSFVRRYRTPSPERPPQRPQSYGGRYNNDRNRERYQTLHFSIIV